MKLIIGLGNPDAKYMNTRHNVGYMVIDKIKNQKLKIKNLEFAKTDTYMNNSGEAVKKLMESGKLKMENLYVVHDDLDIPLGSFKIQFGKGPKDHNGIKSVEEELGTKDFWRIRVGIENRKVEEVDEGRKSRISGEEYTLQDFLPEESKIIEKVVDEICRSLQKLEMS